MVLAPERFFYLSPGGLERVANILREDRAARQPGLIRPTMRASTGGQPMNRRDLVLGSMTASYAANRCST
jgi:hypothetical protein